MVTKLTVTCSIPPKECRFQGFKECRRVEKILHRILAQNHQITFYTVITGGPGAEPPEIFEITLMTNFLFTKF